jgi:acid stress-induced BolA-like protein IbaG/YrbA
MSPDGMRQRIVSALPDAQLEIRGADCSFEVVVVSAGFEGKAQLARQRFVLALFGAELAAGTLHALSVRALAPGEVGGARSGLSSLS